MYSETIRNIGKDAAQRLQERIQSLRRENKADYRLYGGCLGFFWVCAIGVYFWYRDSQFAAFNVACGYVVISAIVGSVMLEGAVKNQQKMRTLRATIIGGSVHERHVVSTRCLGISTGEEDVDDPAEAIYYFDIGEQGTLAIDCVDVPNPCFPNSDMTFLQVIDVDGVIFDDFVDCQGEPLQPLALFDRQEVDDTPGLEGLADMKSYTTLPDSFDDLLKMLRTTF